MQRFFTWAAALAIVGSLLTAGTQVAAQPIEMIMTDELATSHWSTKIIDQFAKTIEERS